MRNNGLIAVTILAVAIASVVVVIMLLAPRASQPTSVDLGTDTNDTRGPTGAGTFSSGEIIFPGEIVYSTLAELTLPVIDAGEVDTIEGGPVPYPDVLVTKPGGKNGVLTDCELRLLAQTFVMQKVSVEVEEMNEAFKCIALDRCSHRLAEHDHLVKGCAEIMTTVKRDDCIELLAHLSVHEDD